MGASRSVPDAGPAPSDVEATSAAAPTTRTSWLLALLVLVAVGPFVQAVTAQPASRYALTAGIVEEGTLRLDGYREVLQVDRAEVDGHVYSDKPPGQPVLAVPVLAVGQAFGVEPATVPRELGNLGVWWVTLWSSTVPAAALAVLMYRVAARRHPRTAALAAGSLAFATMLLPFASELYGHLLAALAAFGAWALLSRDLHDRRAALLAGLLVGAGIAVEYQLLLVGVVLGTLLLARRALPSAVAYAVGVVPGALLLALYQAVAFGSPFAFPYDNKPHLTQQSDVAVGFPSARTLVEALVGPRGIFLFTPIVLIGVVAAVVLVRRHGRSATGDHAWMALGTFGALLLLIVTRQTDWPNPLGGEMPGPRYLIPALPFLAVPLAWAWERAERWCVLATGIGLVTMGATLVTLHLVPKGGAVLVSHLDNIERFGFTPSVLTVTLGDGAWVLHAAGVVVVLVLLARSVAAERASSATPVPAGP